MVHKFMDLWRTGSTPEAAWTRAEELLNEHLELNSKYYHAEELQNIESVRSLVKGMCRAIPKYFKRDKSKLVATEYTLAAKIRDLKGDFSVYTGTADVIIQTKEGFWILDYKIKGKFENDTSDWLKIDNQTIGYNWLLRQELKERRFIIKSNKPVIGVTWIGMLASKIRHKQNQTLEEYWDELEQVYLKDPDKHFKKFTARQQEEHLERFEEDLYADALEIQRKGVRRTRNTAHCLKWGSPCPYMDVCINGFTRMNKGKFEYKKPNYWVDEEHINLEEELGV